ncbi:unnamed protein product (macronuclear) [Paramecium tetraurelia]|uniref:Insulin-like growth factor binding protein, N-terminal n=1 Tax=Paramecium tetraurelia TaxID=5888 RepID=A0BFT2_PARTE|nr:uncharacterized protein GSPATT00028434001 [Paramecium tetraurelia]CAK57399.1 unnamed protein product [Paramecium tetraurelia]|eukprot:XP_001424797.1 hypothetical protein (macronuclear) [Paramecium tetraurelia strain d4-2]
MFRILLMVRFWSLQTMLTKYYLDESNNTCQPICGDNILAPNEVCEDGNDIEFDGCFECQFQCQVDCRFCFLENVYNVWNHQSWSSLKENAEAGFYYQSSTNSCVNLCGDGIVTGQEECDDTNIIPYDGCFDCRFQCNKQCELCDKGVCLIETCPLGSIWINKSCCGDAIQNGDEECDDGNHIDYDGCSNCRFQCHQFCNICLNGICKECFDEYTLDQNKCVKQQSILVDNGDSNHLRYNQDYICLDDECAFSLKPKMSLIYLNQTFSHQYVEINFNQQIQYAKMPNKGQFSPFEIQIQNLSEEYYKIQLYPIRDITYDLQFVQYVADIEIFLDLQEEPILQITLIQTVINYNNQTIIEPNQSIFLQEPRILSDELKSRSVAISKTSKAFMISAITISSVSFIFGDSTLLNEALNILQYQSYLKFINLEYPENSYIYFQSSEMLSISNYLSNLQIDYVLGVITSKEEEQIILDGKFAQYDVDCDLILNLIPQCPNQQYFQLQFLIARQFILSTKFSFGLRFLNTIFKIYRVVKSYQQNLLTGRIINTGYYKIQVLIQFEINHAHFIFKCLGYFIQTTTTNSYQQTIERKRTLLIFSQLFYNNTVLNLIAKAPFGM